MKTEATHGSRERGTRRVPERTCVGCGEKGPPDAMIRLVVDRGEGGVGEVAVDMKDSAFGRGAHVHAVGPCVAKAARGGLARSMKAAVRLDVAELSKAVHDASLLRARGILAGAARGGLVKWGADTVEKALREGAPLLVVAGDAARPEATPAFSQAISGGNAVVLATKQELGVLFRQEEVAFCAVLDHKVASELRRLCALAVVSLSWSDASVSRSKEACLRSPEGR